MKKILTPVTIFCCMLLSLEAIASGKFNGSMNMVLTMPGGNADATYYFGNDTQRMDMTMKMRRIPEPLKTSVITKASRPDEALVINHATRSYSAVNLRSAAENATLLDFDSNYTLKRLGNTTIKGYECEHIALESKTEKLELWVASDLGDFSTFRILQSQNPRLSNTSLAKTLKEAGVEGFPVKIVQQNSNGTSTMELTGIQRKKPDASLFRVPRGYTKTESNRKPISSKEKEHMRSLMEKMKNFEK